jgi:hypothetical protein
MGSSGCAKGALAGLWCNMTVTMKVASTPQHFPLSKTVKNTAFRFCDQFWWQPSTNVTDSNGEHLDSGTALARPQGCHRIEMLLYTCSAFPPCPTPAPAPAPTRPILLRIMCPLLPTDSKSLYCFRPDTHAVPSLFPCPAPAPGAYASLVFAPAWG